MNALPESDVARLLEAARGTWFYLPTLLAISAGLRRGELLALRWDDIDLDAGTLTVRQALEQTKKGLAFKAPKSRRSRRTVALPAVVIAALRKHKGEQAALRLQLGSTEHHSLELVFAWEDGRPIRPDTLTQAYARLAKRLGIASPACTTPGIPMPPF